MVLTFVLLMPPILQQRPKRSSPRASRGPIVARVLLTLLPQALGITIPMALLLGILIGLGRLSADREFVALQACGVSLFRVLRPIAAASPSSATAATAYEMIVALPNANQTFREITFNVVASKAESDIKPRVFFDEFPNRVIYVRDLPPEGGWRDVFLADSTRADQTTVYFAKRGPPAGRSRPSTTVQLHARGRHAPHHATRASPRSTNAGSFERLVLNTGRRDRVSRARRC